MTLEAKAGPIVAWGQQPARNNQPPPDYNPDRAPSLYDAGVGILDPRFGYAIGGSGNSALLAAGFTGGGFVVLNQAPSTAAVANIAAAANVVNGTPMTLVSVSGAGITVMAAAQTIPQTGLVVPSGSLAIDSQPALTTFGQSASVGVPDITKALARVVSITGSLSATGGNFLVSGYDLYGNPQTETIAAGAGAVTTNGKKGWKFIKSATPQFTDAHNYSVGTADIFEFPLRVDLFGWARIVWNNGVITANTGFTAADTTNPATGATGSVRGTYAVQSASDGIEALQIMIWIPPSNLASTTGLFGVTPA